VGLAPGKAVTSTAIHRVIEQQAVVRGEDVAIVDGDQHITYRELNQRANALARRLMAHGFRRGAHASVCLPCGADLAFVLLAVLKSGGSYTWLDPQGPEATQPRGIAIRVAQGDVEEMFLHVDCASLMSDLRAAPNLPVVTRGSDVACILHDGDGSRTVHVPHDALAAVRAADESAPALWTGEPGALDLWVALMTGRTAVVEEKPLDVAA
jgi:acyl-coenzyme A synthetase/AMP-(fatty) acid ligase